MEERRVNVGIFLCLVTGQAYSKLLRRRVHPARRTSVYDTDDFLLLFYDIILSSLNFLFSPLLPRQRPMLFHWIIFVSYSYPVESFDSIQRNPSIPQCSLQPSAEADGVLCCLTPAPKS